MLSMVWRVCGSTIWSCGRSGLEDVDIYLVLFAILRERVDAMYSCKSKKLILVGFDNVFEEL